MRQSVCDHMGYSGGISDFHTRSGQSGTFAGRRVFAPDAPTLFSENRASFVEVNLPADIAFLHRYGIGYPDLKAAVDRSGEYNVTAARALICSGILSEADYYRCAAIELGLEFVNQTPVTDGAFEKTPCAVELEKMACIVAVDGPERAFHIVPNMADRSSLESLFTRWPFMRSRLRVTTPTANRRALEGRAQTGLLKAAVSKLSINAPRFSAKVVFTMAQVSIFMLAIGTIVVLANLASGALVLALHLFATIFYLGCISVRLFATLVTDGAPPKSGPFGKQGTKSMPVYTVMVALYQEAGQVRDLVDALVKLEWPAEKLEIKLVCEADDGETIRAIEDAIERRKVSHMSVVRVPVQEPRTKPKALNYTLPLCKGRYVVIYDAEDRPDPKQLLEAYATFQESDDEVVCLQAPLVIHNGKESWLSGLFAIEYSALFDGLLPALAGKNLPFPLGGTSNHFKRAILEKIGAWDPYNVTEDADLGVRFARLGYRTGTITRPTSEEAPIEFDVWKKQRTRWFKGWLQTWLVHMRHPVQLGHDLGRGGTIAFHIMITGMIVSALVHPLLLYFIAAALWKASQSGLDALIAQPLFWLDLMTITLGYLAFCMLAWRTLAKRKLTDLRSLLWTVPAYWMLLSVAAWRAVWQLIFNPHKWEKTPHRLGGEQLIQVQESALTASGPVLDSLN